MGSNGNWEDSVQSADAEGLTKCYDCIDKVLGRGSGEGASTGSAPHQPIRISPEVGSFFMFKVRSGRRSLS